MDHTSMEHLKSTPKGVEFDIADVDHNHHYYMGGHGGTKSCNPWGYVAAAAAGGILGWAGKSAWNHDHHGNRHGDCGSHEHHGGCGEDRYVNRFELKQAEELACKDATIAKLESEKFTEKLFNEAKNFALCAADKAADRVAACLGKTVEAIAATLGKTVDKVCEIDKHVAVEDEKIHCLDEKLLETRRDTNKALKEQWRRTKTEFVHRPHVKLCCGEVKIECGCEGERDDD